MAVDYDFNPALLNKKVILLEEIVKEDSFGTPKSYWHPVAKVKASIEPMSGREYWLASQAQGEATVRIMIRYRKGVTSRMRVRYKSHDKSITYELKSPPINKFEGNKYLELMCRELAENES